MTDLSVIVPVRDEAPSLRGFHDALRSALEEFPGTVEILYVENGSRDESLAVLQTLPDAMVLSLSSDPNKTENAAALRAGFDHAQGRLIATIDADLQHDPADLLRFLQHLDGFDAVVGWRRRRSGGVLARAVSIMGFVLRRVLRLSAVHDSGSGLRLLRRECVQDLPLYGEWHRFLPDLLAMRGWEITECAIAHPPRPSGASKFPWTKGPRAFADLLALAFVYHLGDRPMQAFGKVGIVFFGASFAVLLGGLGLGIGVGLGLLGIECFFLGFAADAIVRALMRSQSSYRILSLQRNPNVEFPYREAENTMHDLPVLASK